jgi:hypothetical protein
VRFGKAELRGPTNGDEDMKPALSGSDFGHADAETPDLLRGELAF